MTRTDWYCELAGDHGRVAAWYATQLARAEALDQRLFGGETLLLSRTPDQAYKYAREAGHYGNIVLDCLLPVARILFSEKETSA